MSKSFKKQNVKIATNIMKKISINLKTIRIFLNYFFLKMKLEDSFENLTAFEKRYNLW